MTEDGNATRRANRRSAWSAVLVVALIVAVSTVVAFGGRNFIENERLRELRGWQDRMAVVVDSRVAAIHQWLGENFRQLTTVAENAAVQLYVSEVVRGEGIAGQPGDLQAQRGYLRNLLTLVADQGGFRAAPLGPEINANVRRIGLAGVAIIDRSGRPIVATPDFPPLSDELRNFIQGMRMGRQELFDMHENPAGRPSIGFLVPLFAVQSDRGPSDQIGSILGIKQVDDSFFELLRQPGNPSRSAEAILVRVTDGLIEYLSPLRDGTLPLHRRLDPDTPELAEARAIAAPGGFGAGRDYRGVRVLWTGRQVVGAPWSVIYKLDREEALAASDERILQLAIALMLAGLAAVAIVWAVWRHGVSRRTNVLSEQNFELAARFEAQHRFLRALSDTQPERVSILDRLGVYIYANRVVAKSAGLEPNELEGKSLASVLGPEPAKRIAALNERALAEHAMVRETHREGSEEEPIVVFSEHIPMESPGGTLDRVLVIERNISEAVRESDRSEGVQRQLVAALSGLMDRRDPGAATHSDRVARLAGRIARQMDLEPRLVETVETAGRLLNLGKMLVPEQILTRPSKLAEDEMSNLRAALLNGADIVAGIDFGGPVADTIRQSQEHLDGSGFPNRLVGENILLTARIVAVANAFVALVSLRARRARRTAEEALDVLLAASGTLYDRKVVVALAHDLENRGGRRYMDVT